MTYSECKEFDCRHLGDDLTFISVCLITNKFGFGVFIVYRTFE